MSEVRGKPFAPGNKFGKGRPKGSRNKFNPEAKELLSEYSVPLMKTMIKMGLDKDAAILKVLIPAIMKLTDQTVKLGKLSIKTIADIDKVSADLFRKAASGDITLGQWAQLSEILENRRKAIVSYEFDQRLRAVEQS